MPVPFQDLDDSPNLGLAGYLCFQNEPNGKGIRAALFFVTSRGEPVEFSFTRVDVAASFLWRSNDARRYAVASLSRELFKSCSKRPVLLVALADAVPPQVFTEDLRVQVPMCRISTLDAAVHSSGEALEVLSDKLNLFWVGQAPAQDSQQRILLESLQTRNLLTEPFERALAGLDEAYKNT